jgi:cytidine deaminase
MDADLEALVTAAREVRARAHAPYSGFRVGAALVTASGEVFTGANVENASLGLTLCAERSAVVAAVSAGHREFTRVVIVTERPEPIQPCGACRQFLAEFAPDLAVTTVGESGDQATTSLADLLPGQFRLDG